MFCPKCAAELLPHHGELTCIAGEMGLSKYVERVLTERYSNHLPSLQRDEAIAEPHSWYCPGCGVPLCRDLGCPECHLSLRDLQHQLVELHPHKIIEDDQIRSLLPIRRSDVVK